MWIHRIQCHVTLNMNVARDTRPAGHKREEENFLESLGSKPQRERPEVGAEALGTGTGRGPACMRRAWLGRGAPWRGQRLWGP